jgi:hypothetical protein
MVDLPNSCVYAWKWFTELNSRRSSGMQPNPISYPDVYAKSVLENYFLTKQELSLLFKFDEISLRTSQKEQEKRQERQVKSKK